MAGREEGRRTREESFQLYVDMTWSWRAMWVRYSAPAMRSALSEREEVDRRTSVTELRSVLNHDLHALVCLATFLGVGPVEEENGNVVHLARTNVEDSDCEEGHESLGGEGEERRTVVKSVLLEPNLAELDLVESVLAIDGGDCNPRVSNVDDGPELAQHALGEKNSVPELGILH